MMVEGCDSVPDPQALLRRKRQSLLWHLTTQQTTAAKHPWFMALLKQHPDPNSLFMEFGNVPYITLDNGPVYDRLVTEAFQGEAMVPL